LTHIRFMVWVGALRGERSGEWRARRGRGLGLGFGGHSGAGGINRRGRADWVVPFVGCAAQRALTGRSNHVPGRAT
jgi:hypothetical protein